MSRDIGNSKTPKQIVKDYFVRNIFAKVYGIDDADLPKIKATEYNSVEWIEKFAYDDVPKANLSSSEMEKGDIVYIQNELQLIAEYPSVLVIEAPSSLSVKPFDAMANVMANMKVQALCRDMLKNEDHTFDQIGSFMLGKKLESQPENFKLSIPIDLKGPSAVLILEGIISADTKGLSETRDVFNALQGRA